MFTVEESPAGGYHARALGYSIFTQADSVAELREMVRNAVRCHFDSDSTPAVIRLHFVRDDLVPTREVSTGGDSTTRLRKFSKEARKLAVNFHDHVETQVGLAAMTAYLVLVADTILLNAYVSLFKDFLIGVTALGSIPKIAVMISGSLLMLGTLLGLSAALPAHRSREAKNSLFYYRNIARPDSPQVWCAKFRENDQDGRLHEDLLVATWGKSRWLRRMFNFARAGIFCTILGTLLMAIALVLMAWMKQPTDTNPKPAGTSPVLPSMSQAAPSRN